jgi:hypothetical protein
MGLTMSQKERSLPGGQGRSGNLSPVFETPTDESVRTIAGLEDAAEAIEAAGMERRRWLSWREIEPEDACPKCGGSGAVVYPSTTKWAGGIGGQMLTPGACDQCWGSGDLSRPGVDQRRLARLFREVPGAAEWWRGKGAP